MRGAKPLPPCAVWCAWHGVTCRAGPVGPGCIITSSFKLYLHSSPMRASWLSNSNLAVGSLQAGGYDCGIFHLLLTLPLAFANWQPGLWTCNFWYLQFHLLINQEEVRTLTKHQMLQTPETRKPNKMATGARLRWWLLKTCLGCLLFGQWRSLGTCLDIQWYNLRLCYFGWFNSNGLTWFSL